MHPLARGMFTAACMTILWAVPRAWATSFVAPSDLGVVCLDEPTGRTEWEFFPEHLGPCQLASDGRYLYIGSNEATGREVPGGPRLQAVDLTTHEEVDNPSLPASVQMTQPRWARTLHTPNGDRIVTKTANRRAVVILQGDSDDVRSVVPFPAGYEQVDVHGNALILSRMLIPLDSPEPAPQVTAIDLGTRAELWTCRLGDLNYPTFLGSGERNIYVAQKHTLRAINPGSGQNDWDAHLQGVDRDSWTVEHGGRTYVACRFGAAFDDAIYCLDAATGAVLWQKTPWESLFPSVLLFHDGKIYTFIRMAGLTSHWSHWGAWNNGTGHIVDDPEQGQIEAIREQFRHKTPEEIELDLRAWHALGDRAAFRVLKAAGDAVSDPRLKEVAGKLLESYPPRRDYNRLVTFLSNQLDHNQAAQVRDPPRSTRFQATRLARTGTAAWIPLSARFRIAAPRSHSRSGSTSLKTTRRVATK